VKIAIVSYNSVFKGEYETEVLPRAGDFIFHDKFYYKVAYVVFTPSKEKTTIQVNVGNAFETAPIIPTER
jgi:hypothetical protein